jgi:hypothetical protein
MKQNQKQTIYRVAFNTPPKGGSQTEFFYTSLAAIYDDFQPSQIGCGVKNLYLVGVRDGKPYQSSMCRITKHLCSTKRQNAPRTGVKTSESDNHTDKTIQADIRRNKDK